MVEAKVPNVGDAAPAFRLPAFPAGTVDLAKFKGKMNVVLYFYPRDDTPGCTKEACEFRDQSKKLERLDTVILGVSTDSVDSHEKLAGDSMSPRYRDGDLVITSANRPAIDGYPCIARQADQIGVNCKIYKDDGEDVVLIPVNEAYAPERLPRSQLQWAHRVLYSVRLTGNR